MKIIFQIKEKDKKFEDAIRIAFRRKETITEFIDTYNKSCTLLIFFNIFIGV